MIWLSFLTDMEASIGAEISRMIYHDREKIAGRKMNKLQKQLEPKVEIVELNLALKEE